MQVAHEVYTQNHCISEYLPTIIFLTPVEPRLPCICSVDPDQSASEEANWCGSALLVIKYLNLYQQSGLSNLTG